MIGVVVVFKHDRYDSGGRCGSSSMLGLVLLGK